jgi:hypothetical protein
MYGQPRGRFSATGSAIVSERLGRTILGDEIGRAISGGANIGNWMIVWAYVVDVCRRYFHCATGYLVAVCRHETSLSSVTVTGQ